MKWIESKISCLSFFFVVSQTQIGKFQSSLFFVRVYDPFSTLISKCIDFFHISIKFHIRVWLINQFFSIQENWERENEDGWVIDNPHSDWSQGIIITIYTQLATRNFQMKLNHQFSIALWIRLIVGCKFMNSVAELLILNRVVYINLLWEIELL